MKRVVFFAVICITMFASEALMAQNENYIEVHGSAEKKVSPDRITMSVTINESDYRKRTVTSSENSVAALEKEMKAALTAIGIDVKKALKVDDISSNFAKIKVKNPDALLTKRYKLEVADAKTAFLAVTALEDAGISNVDIVKSEYSAMDSLKIAVKAEAMKNARAMALAMTSAIGQDLGKAIYIYEHETRSDNSYRPMMMTKAYAADSVEAAVEEVDLEFKEIKVTCNVTVRFAL